MPCSTKRAASHEEFVSTRSSSAPPCEFAIGDALVEGRMDVTDIPAGLNEGLVTMAQGEVASFDDPDYDELGSLGGRLPSFRAMLVREFQTQASQGEWEGNRVCVFFFTECLYETKNSKGFI